MFYGQENKAVTNRKRFAIAVATAVAVLTTCAASLAGQAKAVWFGDQCPNVSAQANITLDQSAVSPPGNYTQGLCLRFVTDIAVPGTGGAPFAISVNPANPSAWEQLSDCSYVKVRVTLYSKGFLSTGFSSFADGTFQGYWNPADPGTCSFKETSGDLSLQTGDDSVFYWGVTGPQKLGARTIRAAVSITYVGYEPVSVTAIDESKPPN
jgi:hypothetical protein